MNIGLIPLTGDDREQFILDNQEAFNYGALDEFDRRSRVPKKVPFVRVSGISCYNCFGLTDKHKRGEIYETRIGNCKMRIGMLSLF